MGIVTLPTLDTSADVFARAGLAICQRLANVEAVIDGVPVVGWDTNAQQTADLAGMPTRNTRRSFSCMSVDLPPGVKEVSSAVTVGATAYRVAVRTDHKDLGQVTLDLERL